MLYSTRTRPTGPIGATDFFRRRLLRVFVGYLPFLLLRYVVLARYAEDRLADMSITKSVLLISTDLEELVLGISWTLTFELYFYLLFGLTMLLPRRLLLRAWLFIGVGIGLPYVIGAQFSGWPKTAFSPLVLEFVAGVVLAATIRWWGRQRFVPIFAATAVFGWMVGVGMDGDPSRFRASTFGVGAVGLLGLVILLEQRGWAVGRWMSAAGDASYAVYLAHISFLTLFFTWGIRSWFAELSLLGPEVGVLCFVVFTVLFSIAWFQLIERRSYRASLRWTQTPPRPKHDPTSQQKSEEVGETVRH